MRLTMLAGLLLLLSFPSQEQNAAQRGLTLAQDHLSFLFPLSGRMRWTGSRLAGCDFCQGTNPILWTVTRDGRREMVDFEIAAAGYINVRDVAAGPDGGTAAVGLAISGDSRMGTFIAWISPNSASQVITQVWPYSPNVVTVAPDNTLWTVGAMMNDNHRVVYPNVLRHYAPSGQLLQSTIIRGIRKASGGMYKVSEESVLMASDDRIGWLTSTCQYLEFSFDAVELGSYACPNDETNILHIAGVGLSSADDLLLADKWLSPLAPLSLDRSAKTWRPVSVLQDTGKTQEILGFDGLTLVTSAMTDNNGSAWMRRYSWSTASVGR